MTSVATSAYGLLDAPTKGEAFRALRAQYLEAYPKADTAPSPMFQLSRETYEVYAVFVGGLITHGLVSNTVSSGILSVKLVDNKKPQDIMYNHVRITTVTPSSGRDDESVAAPVPCLQEDSDLGAAAQVHATCEVIMWSSLPHSFGVKAAFCSETSTIRIEHRVFGHLAQSCLVLCADGTASSVPSAKGGVIFTDPVTAVDCIVRTIRAHCFPK